jgi:NitT/TauT family transport system substrate-binding protein
MRRLAITAAALVVSFAASAAGAAETLAVALNWVPGGDDAALYYARKLGWYRDAGIELELEAGKGSAGSVQRVAVGQTQLGLADMGVVINGRGKGAGVVAIVNLYANSALGFYWLKSSGITGVADFAGKRIGVPAGDTHRVLWPALAKKAGVDPGAVTWVNVDPNGKLAALKAKAIDVTPNFYNVHHIMARELGADMGFLPWRAAGINPYGLSFIVNQAYLAANPETVGRFVQVTQRAYAACVATPQPCVEALVETVSGTKLDTELINWRLTMVLMSDPVSREMALGWHDDRRMADDYALIQEYLTIERPYDVHEVYTNRFLDPAIKMVGVPEPSF